MTETRHDIRTPPFAFTRRLVIFVCLFAAAVTGAAFAWPDRAVKILDVLQIAGGLLGGCLLAYAGRTAITDNAGALVKLIRGDR